MPSWASNITPKNIPVRLKAGYKALLSWRQLSALAAQGPQKDLAQLYAQMHFHITDPIMSVVMLLVSLPILVCRDPKSMKTAIMISFGVTAMCLITTFVCKMLATETMEQALALAAADLGAELDALVVPHALLTLPIVQS